MAALSSERRRGHDGQCCDGQGEHMASTAYRLETLAPAAGAPRQFALSYRLVVLRHFGLWVAVPSRNGAARIVMRDAAAGTRRGTVCMPL